MAGCTINRTMNSLPSLSARTSQTKPPSHPTSGPWGRPWSAGLAEHWSRASCHSTLFQLCYAGQVITDRGGSEPRAAGCADFSFSSGLAKTLSKVGSSQTKLITVFTFQFPLKHNFICWTEAHLKIKPQDVR